jgi:osmotically-inducible protein OsmY
MNFARKPAARAALAMAALIGLAGCAPLIVGGAMVGGALVATDRRTTGAQVEDQSIEIKASRRIDQLATLGHVNVTSYNRKVLLTGEVPAERERERVEQAVRQIENVQAVVNELAVAGNSSLGARSNDAYLSTKVKASLVDAKDLQSNAIKVLTERGVVYLMGRVTEREATRASNLARTVPGVQKVVQVFEVLSEAELAELVPPKSSEKK